MKTMHRRNARMTALLLLSGTALGWSGAALAQDQAPPASAPAADATQQGDTAAAATPDQSQVIVVTGNPNRLGLRKLDASYSISTATAEQIREVQPISTADLLKIVPGVWTETSGGETGANVFIRGFPSTGDAPFLTIEMTGSKSKLVFQPLPADDPKQRQPDITLAKQTLGWEPKVPLREGLSRTIQYFDRLLREKIAV